MANVGARDCLAWTLRLTPDAMRPYPLRTVGKKRTFRFAAKWMSLTAPVMRGAGGHITSTAPRLAFRCLTITISCVRRQKPTASPALPGECTTVYKRRDVLQSPTQHLPHPQAVISLIQKGLWWCHWSFPQGGPISDSLEISAWGVHPHFQQLNWRQPHLEESNREWGRAGKQMWRTAWPEEVRQSDDVRQICLWAALVSKICKNSDAQTLNRARVMGGEGKTAQAQLTHKKIIRPEQWWLCIRFLFSVAFLSWVNVLVQSFLFIIL